MSGTSCSDLDRVVEVWRRNHRIQSNSVAVYLRWIRRFKIYCLERGTDWNSNLTLTGSAKFAKGYARTTGIDERTAHSSARSALRAWSAALTILGEPAPQWGKSTVVSHSRAPLVAEFAEFLRDVRGNPEVSICAMTAQVEGFLTFLHSRRKRIGRVRLIDIDAYVQVCSERFARTTTAGICSALRAFLRFLHSTGRLPCDLSSSVAAPRVRRGERPLRALPWESVQQILQAVDRSTPLGRRDYAMLLMMSSYGLGAGEVIRLTLDDVNWGAATLRVVRPKTGVVNLLPLLPAVARALVDYLQHGRPVDAPTRHLIVSAMIPHAPVTASSAVRHALIKYARAAGVSAPYLGSHVLRHSHACKQMEVGTRTKVIGDILGHSHPDSTSAYLRVSTERLRDLALAIPR